MQLSAEQQQQLSRTLSAEYACAQSLLELLQKEQRILKTEDAEALNSISKDKQQLVIRMHRHSREREQMVNRLQPDGNTNDLLKNRPEHELKQLWKQLGEIAIELQQQNEINGGMVALNQRHTRQALDILCGRSGDREIYGARGEYRQMESGKPLAKA